MSRLVDGVVFDVGYTLIDETRRWREWAAWLGVEEDELFASLKTAITGGLQLVTALRGLQPGFDLKKARADRARAGRDDVFLGSDLYPDVSPCIASLKAAGYKLGAAGNMSEEVERLLVSCGLGLHMVGSSERWRIAKPDAAFFRKIAAEMDLPIERLAYVGDRVDNDVAPAAVLGMRAILLRRGLWAQALAERPEQAAAYAVIDSLVELPGVLAGGPLSEGSRSLPKRIRKVRPASR